MLMNFKLKPQTKEAIIAISISGIIIVSFYLLISHLNVIGGIIASIFSALVPFIFGICFAFILIPLRNIAEEKLLSRFNLSDKAKRNIAVAISIITMILILVGFFALLVPQIISSVSTFAGNLSYYITKSQTLIEQYVSGDTKMLDSVYDILLDGASQLAKMITGSSNGLSKIVVYVGDTVKFIINFLIGIIIALYLLLDTEKFKMQMKKLTFCILPEDIALGLVSICKLTADMFYKFISGKAIDSLIIGIICYVGCKLLNMPYAVLIALVVGVTNMIPVFGPFIGAIPCLIILVMIDWVKAAEFLVFIIILQQCDGNIIGPYILGDAVGLPTLWVMFAIIVGGALFGIVGMFIGVPTFAVIYTLVKQGINRRLKDKNLDFDGVEHDEF